MKHKRALYRYNLSLLFASIGMIGLIASILHACFIINRNANFNPTTLIPNGIFAFVMLLVICISLNIRRSSKLDAFTDEFGNSTRNYSTLSGSERRKVDLINISKNESILPTSELKSMIFPGSTDALNELNDMIGLSTVKQEVKKMSALYEYHQQDVLSAKHMCFLGSPGTGKTSVAKIITGILYKYNQIQKNELVYLDAATLLSSSNPLKKTQLILQKSHNRVLFIDEAYALAFDKAYGPEILALILNTMENYRSSLVVIFAGYREEMKCLFAMNSGLQSRFGKYFFFEDYNQFEMMQIFEKLANQHEYLIHENARQKLMQVFIWNKCLKSFANGRTVRKLYEDTINNHYFNLSNHILDADYEKIIMAIDVEEHFEEDNYFSSF